MELDLHRLVFVARFLRAKAYRISTSAHFVVQTKDLPPETVTESNTKDKQLIVVYFAHLKRTVLLCMPLVLSVDYSQNKRKKEVFYWRTPCSPINS